MKEEELPVQKQSYSEEMIETKLENESTRSDICGKDKDFEKDTSLHDKTSNQKDKLEKPVQCEICDEIFATRQVLKTHVKTVHDVRTMYVCELCDMKFKQVYNLQAHTKNAHGLANHFECKTCGKHFARKGNLSIHVKTVHAHWPNPLTN